MTTPRVRPMLHDQQDMTARPTSQKEAERVAFTLAGVAIAILIEVIATKVQERGARQSAS
jgi:hypothetical protein